MNRCFCLLVVALLHRPLDPLRYETVDGSARLRRSTSPLSLLIFRSTLYSALYEVKPQPVDLYPSAASLLHQNLRKKYPEIFDSSTVVTLALSGIRQYFGQPLYKVAKVPRRILFLNLFVTAPQRNDLAILSDSFDRGTAPLVRGSPIGGNIVGVGNPEELSQVSIQPPKLFHSSLD
jgi:hypothetical protein